MATKPPGFTNENGQGIVQTPPPPPGAQKQQAATPPPPLPGLSAQDAEIKRKAEQGIALLAPTPEKTAAYNQYKQQFVNKRQAQNFAQVDPNQYKVQTATIDDIAAKYGFDFSRSYANRQAEAEAQARRNANADASRRNTSAKDLNMKAIDNNLMSQAEGLDRNYFQQYQQQAQAQVNGGINGGIAADQDLRMAMARQASMSDSYRDANLGRMQENQRFTNDDIRLAEDLGLINQQALAREDSLYNDRLMQGAGLAMETDRFNLSQNQGLMNAVLQQRGQNIGVEQWLQEFDRMKGRDVRSDFESDRGYNRGVLESDRDYDLNRDTFNWQQTTDARDFNRGVFESDRGYDYQVGRDKVTDGQWEKGFGLDKDKFDWSKYVDGRQLSQGDAELAQRKREAAANGTAPVKAKTGPQTAIDATNYWAGQLDTIQKDGAYRVEQALRNNPQAMQDLVNQGYNLDLVIDSLYNVASEGKFKNKKSYTDYYNQVVKDAEKNKYGVK